MVSQCGGNSSVSGLGCLLALLAAQCFGATPAVAFRLAPVGRSATDVYSQPLGHEGGNRSSVAPQRGPRHEAVHANEQAVSSHPSAAPTLQVPSNGSIATRPSNDSANHGRAKAFHVQPVQKEVMQYFDVGDAGKVDMDLELGGILPSILDLHGLRGKKALQSVHDIALWVVMPGMVVLVFVLLVGSWMSFQRYTALIPDSAWQVFLSALCGFFIRGLIHAGVISGHTYVHASATFLNLFLLPVIIFQSGWALKHADFLYQLEYISIFAVLGTIVSFFFIGFAGYWLGQNGFFIISGLRENLAFAALISATDPVATLCTFSKLGLDRSQPLLYTLLYGESVLNDAVAIVLFHAVNASWGDLSVGHCISYVCILLFGSALFGIFVSAILVWLLRVVRLPGNTVPETLYIVACAWLVFAAAEAVDLSGIIANLCAGCVFRLYGARHLERKGFQLTDDVLMATAQLMDCMVFILCGVSTALIDSPSGVLFAVYAFVLCMVGRALSTTSSALLSNGIKLCMGEPSSHFITAKHQVMMWHAGLRGGIALLLSMDIDTTWCRNKATIINATFIIICSTLVLFGSTTEPVLRSLGMQDDGPREVDTEDEDGNMQRREASGLIDEVSKDAPAKIKQTLLRMAHSSFKSVLVGDARVGKERRQKSRAFLESMRKTGSLREALCGDEGFVTCDEFSGSEVSGRETRT